VIFRSCFPNYVNMIESKRLALVVDDIKLGIRSQRERLHQAEKNIRFFNDSCHHVQGITKTANLEDHHSDRQSWILREIVAIKTNNLYKQSPTRRLPGNDEATDWLESIYKQNGIFAKWQAADRLSMVADIAFFGVGATGDPNDAIRINLYGSDQIAAWSSPEDPTKPVAICVIADHPDTDKVVRTYTLWTDEKIFTFEAKAAANVAHSNMEPPALTKTETNPYGIIPFVAVHYEFPSYSFWTASPGTYLYRINRYLNWRLTEIAKLIRDNPPMKVIENADANFQPPQPFRSQDFLQVPGAGPGSSKDGSFRYEQANLGFVSQEWDDLDHLIDHTCECCGVPPAAYRQVQTTGKSGSALMVEQTSLLEWVKSRQHAFAEYEAALAKVCLQVQVAYYGETALTPALDDFSLTVKWADLYPNIPGDARDKADEWDLRLQLTSKIQLLMKRNSMTREEAVAHLQQVETDLKEEQAILGEVTAAVQQTANSGQEGQSPGDQETDGEDIITNQETNED
jgi:hypothetical protein